uniref:Serpentine Receptor, class T n=1 Tax=Caenorhabditis tropicalis TaxID=1561998 RepID=A0A1I7TYB2_9PELO
MATPVPNCALMEDFATSIPLKASLSMNLLITIIALPVLVYSMEFIRKTQVFHRNTRLQIWMHLFGLLLHCVGRLLLHSIDLGNYFTRGENACDIIPNFYRCLVLRGFYNVGLALSSMCSVSLVLERFVAYHLSYKYEYCGRFFGIVLMFFQNILALCYLTSMYFHAAFVPGNFTLYYCQTIASSTGSVWFVIGPLYSVMIAQIVSRLMFKVLMWKSQNLRVSDEIDLSCRFNLEQSIRSLEALKLLVNCNTIVFAILSVVTTTLHFNAASLSKPNYMALVEAVHILPLYGIAICYGVHSKLRVITENKKELISKGMKANGDNYFNQFRQQIK